MATKKHSKPAAASTPDTPDTWQFGHDLAREYFDGLRGVRKDDAIDGLKRSVSGILEGTGGPGECLRGFLEGLAERYWAVVRDPKVDSAPVQQALESAAEAAREASFIVESIKIAANRYSDIDDTPMLSLVAYSAQLGGRAIDKVEELIDTVQEHRAEGRAA